MARPASAQILVPLGLLLGAPAAAQLEVPAPQMWTQAAFPMPAGEGVESNEQFGATLATGDFNGDGFDDLAVGAPSTSSPTAEGVGAVNVFYGSPTGLSGDRAVWLEPPPSSVNVPAQADGYFGLSLAALDVNADGFDELAIGHPYLRVATFSSCGAVHIVSGGAGGLTLEVDSIDQSRLLGGTPGAGDNFGLTLKSGRFNDGPLSVRSISTTARRAASWPTVSPTSTSPSPASSSRATALAAWWSSVILRVTAARNSM